MRGVRRAGVTVALHDLESRGLILLTRKSTSSRADRDLRRQPMDFYGATERDLARLLVPYSRRTPQ